jgi:hypothetical protein
MSTFYIAGSLVSFLGPTPLVWGYLDPGTGSMVLQVLLAGMLSSMFFVKTWVRQIRDGGLLKNRRA